MRVLAIAMLLAAAMLSGCAATEEGIQEFGIVEAPDLEAGTVLAYDMEGLVVAQGSVHIDGEEVDSFQDGQRINRTAMATVQILNTSYGPEGAFYIGAQQFAGGPSTLVVDGLGNDVLGKFPIAIRKADLAEFGVLVRQESACDPGCRLTTTSMEIDNQTAFDPRLPFPLSAGKTWENAIPMDTTHGDPVHMVFKHQVRAVKTIDGPDGPLDAVHVRTTLSAPDMPRFSEALEDELRAQGFDDPRVEARLTGGGDLYYADSLDAIVQESVRLDLELLLGFTADGERVESDLRSHAELTSFLRDIDTSAAPELDEAAMFAFFDNGQPLHVPGGGSEPAAGGYTLRTEASAVEFDVAKPQDISFEVTATPAIPPGHRVLFSVSDTNGELLDSGTGAAFEVRFSDPGLYLVNIQAVNEAGLVQAADAMLVVADLSFEDEVSCSPVVIAAAGQGECGDTELPVPSFVGLQDITIDISADDALGQGGTLVVSDEGGNSVESSVSGGASLGAGDLAGLLPGTWTIRYEPDLAARESAAISAVLDYGSTMPDGSATPATGGFSTGSPVEQLLGHLDGLLEGHV